MREVSINQSYQQAIAISNAIISEVKKIVKGKDGIIEKVLIAILAKGHVLLEDIPGVGKTTLATAFSKVTGLGYNRVQFTPDVMPSDITGFTMYRKETNTFQFVKGAALCNLFLADEINRTSPKTQAALLQVMEEGRVTVDLKSYETPKPFTVIATQNPVGHAGTQMLPESQLDRFLMRLSMGYPDIDSEVGILKAKNGLNPLDAIKTVTNAEEILQIQRLIDNIFVSDDIYCYMVNLVSMTRKHELIELGASPRGTVALASVSRVKAFLSNRDYVLPIDVRNAFIDTISHRIIMKSKVRETKTTPHMLLTDILHNTDCPRISRRN